MLTKAEIDKRLQESTTNTAKTIAKVKGYNAAASLSEPQEAPRPITVVTNPPSPITERKR